MSVQSYPVHSNSFNSSLFASVPSPIEPHGQRGLNRVSLAPKVMRGKKSTFPPAPFPSSGKFPGRKPDFFNSGRHTTNLVSKDAPVFRGHNKRKCIGKLYHGRSGDQKPLSTPSHRDTSRGFPNSRFPWLNFSKTPPIRTARLTRSQQDFSFLLAQKKPRSYSRNRVHQLLPRGLPRCFLPFCLDFILLPF